MRVIAGLYRSRPLVSPPGASTRPTSDRLRETLFNILAARRSSLHPDGLQGCRFADLYAGTGAVGIEAISRGAAYVWFAEKSAPALKSLRANLAALKIPLSLGSVEDRGSSALLAALARGNTPLDVLFLDPPYEAEAEYQSTLALLGSPSGGRILAPGAVVVAEFPSKGRFSLQPRYGTLRQVRTLRQGDSSLAFYEPEPGDAPPV